MSTPMATLATNQENADRIKKEKKRFAKEESRKVWIPLSALIVANIIFLSLDIRGFDAMYIITGSYLLAGLTVLVSGGLAMYWFDILFPHSRRHNNDTQRNISLICTILAIGLSGTLAGADYIVGTGGSLSSVALGILWAAIIILTIGQGVAVAWWWSIDNHIAAEAKIEKSHAENADKNDEISIMEAKLSGLDGILNRLKELNSTYDPETVQVVAGFLGIQLPTSAPSGRPAPRAMPSANLQMAASTPAAELAEREPGQAANPTSGGRKNP